MSGKTYKNIFIN